METTKNMTQTEKAFIVLLDVLENTSCLGEGTNRFDVHERGCLTSSPSPTKLKNTIENVQ